MKRKLFIIGLAVIIMSVTVSLIFYKQMKEEKEKAASLSEEKDKIAMEEIEIRKEIKDIKDEKEMFNKELQGQSGKAQQLHEDIAEINNIEKVLSSELSEKERTFFGLKNMLSTILEKQEGLDEELKKAKLDYMSIAERIDYLRKEKQGLEESVKAYIAPPKGIELKKIVVRVAPLLEGSVIEVSREYSFSIIDLGLNDEIRSGNIMAIYRKDAFLAKAVVENVYKDMSSIIVLDEWADVGLAPGDVARLLKP
ncbi:MAG: hypothetical protein ABH843_01180 [Candidatus Omnitrophota bacterium]